MKMYKKIDMNAGWHPAMKDIQKIDCDTYLEGK